MAGKGASRRANARRAQAKKARKEAAEGLAANTHTFSIPAITEDDLLAFQISHFADDTKPDMWFVPAETALHYNPALAEDDDDDGLGYYEDGVKRTLTDHQIEMFRHSEIELILREERLQAEMSDASQEDPVTVPEELHNDQPHAAATSTGPVTKSNSADQMPPEPAAPLPPTSTKTPSQTSRSETSSLSTDLKGLRRPRKQEVPYDQRHKRKWEDYIEAEDPVEGSMTHRRLIREMDDQQDESVDLDY